ncbi:MAG: hypothetical protein ACLR23_23245 [Clostridia bacterium]
MWLGIYIRSSLGFKYGVRLVNSVAVIDADYAWADNEGHLKIDLQWRESGDCAESWGCICAGHLSEVLSHG